MPKLLEAFCGVKVWRIFYVGLWLQTMIDYNQSY